MRTVLLVEDSAQDAELVREAFSQATVNMQMVVVGDGVEALSYLQDTLRSGPKSAPPVMVLLDLRLPKMDGFAVLEYIKADDQLRSIPVVLFSSALEEGDLKRGYKLGANSCVTKPADFSGYVNTMRTITRFWIDINHRPASA